MFVLETGLEHDETLILIHGLGDAGFQDWLKIIPKLEGQYHIVAMDLPGFGYSDQPVARYSPSNYSEIIHWLVEQTAKSKVVVLGSSMGGAIALRYAEKHPDSINKLVLVDAAGILERTAITKYLTELPGESEFAPGFVNRGVYNLKKLGGRLIEMFSVAPNPVGMLQNSELAWDSIVSERPTMNAALSLIMEDFGHAIHNIQHDVYVIWGEEDEVAPLRTAILLAGRLPSANLHIIPGAGHIPMASHPDLFMDYLTQVLGNKIKIQKREPPLIGQSEEDVVLHKQSYKTLTGSYRNITLRQCKEINLQDVVAEKIIVFKSIVKMTNVRVDSDETAIETVGSVITITNGYISGDIAMWADHSSLDLAGVSLVGEKSALTIDGGVRLIFSVSDLSSPRYTGFIHGGIELKKTDIEDALKNL
jgi:pimeloyl-ACP methyl ester carboxylesterase